MIAWLCGLAVAFAVFGTLGVLLAESWPSPHRACIDCGATTPGGSRCQPCADEYVDTQVRYGQFCGAWKWIGVQAYLRFRHVTGVYR